MEREKIYFNTLFKKNPLRNTTFTNTKFRFFAKQF